MASEKELAMGRLAVENHILTQDALDECLVYQSENGRPLSLILIERGYLDDGEIGLLVDLSRRRQERPRPETFVDQELEDVLFANLAVAEGHVRVADLEACLSDRADSQAEGQRITLGQMMVKRKFLSVQTFLELTRKLEGQAFECYQCGSQQTVAGQRTGRAFRCADCGTELRIPHLQELVDHLRAQEASRPGGGPSDSTRVEPVSPAPGGPVDANSLKPGDVFSGYRIVYEIARGGMGIVFRAEQINLGRPVALKIIRTDAGSKDVRIQRFRREAQAIGRLRHPGIVQVYDVGESGGCHYIAMEYLEGRSLDRLIDEGSLRPPDATRVLHDLAQAVAYAHAQGVLHRDLKPSNVIIDAAGKPKLTDFGLAKLAGKETGMELTHSGDIIGTPFYIPPELIEKGSRSISEAGDVYALGVIYYQMLTQRLPFNGGTSVEVYHRILNHVPALPSRVVAGVRRTLDAVCMKAMARDLEGRYATAAELAADLGRVISGQSIAGGTEIRRRPRRSDRATIRPAILWLGGGAILLVALGWAAAWWFYGRSRPSDPPPVSTPEPDPGPRPDEAAGREADYREALARARAAHDAQRWPESIEWAEKAIALFPDRVESFDPAIQLFIAHWSRGDRQRARAAVERGLRIEGLTNDQRAIGLLDLAMVLFEMGEKERALAINEDALRLKPGDYTTIKNKVAFLSGMGRGLEAVPLLVVLSRMRQDDPEIENALAEWEGQYQKALQDSGKHLEAGEWDQVIAAARTALAIFPDRTESFEVGNRLGAALYEKKDLPGAQAAFERCLAIQGVAPEAMARSKGNLGVVLWLSGQRERAMKFTDEALAVLPDEWDFLLHKAQFLHELGRLSEAREIFERLERTRPGDPVVKRFLDELRR